MSPSVEIEPEGRATAKKAMRPENISVIYAISNISSSLYFLELKSTYLLTHQQASNTKTHHAVMAVILIPWGAPNQL